MKIQKPKLRIIHHLARTGGTVISRCLSSMDQIALLSEIHPLQHARSNEVILKPLKQAHTWYGLVSLDESKMELPFVDAISLLNLRAQEKNKFLIIRNWANRDFFSTHNRPSRPNPPFKLRTSDVLREQFELLEVATVRHPIDQWFSLRRMITFKQSPMSLNTFLKRYRAFSELAVEMNFVRYEDFTHNPDKTLKQICKYLYIPFDTKYKTRWSKNYKISGDWLGITTEKKIRPATPLEIDQTVLKMFMSNPDFKAAVKLLGYN